MNTIQAVAATIALAALATIADYFLKLASTEARMFANRWFVAGCLIYAAGAFGWVYVLQSLKLATIGLIYSVGTVLLLAALGYFVFNERLNNFEIAGIAFGIASIVLLSKFSN
jgi:drug/metabolite transporter (DMT)-like permease